MWLTFPNVSLGQIAKLVKFGIQLIITVCSLLLQILRQKIYVCKYIKISNRSYAQIIFMAGEASQGVLNKDPMFASIN
jgi:hypothetical protein